MLPITEMLEEEKKKLSLTELFWFSEIMNKVRTLEEAYHKKAKEEERERIVGVLEEMKLYAPNDIWDRYINLQLQKAITRITN